MYLLHLFICLCINTLFVDVFSSSSCHFTQQQINFLSLYLFMEINIFINSLSILRPSGAYDFIGLNIQGSVIIVDIGNH